MKNKNLIPLNKGRQGKPVNIDGFKGESRDIIAKQSKVGTGTVSKVKFIRDNAPEEVKIELRSGNIKLNGGNGF